MSEPQSSSQVSVVNPHDLDTVTLPECHKPLSVRSFGLTDVGRVRAANEDQFLIAILLKALQVQQTSLPQRKVQHSSDRSYLFVVADGMGGHPGGEQASALAIDSVETFILDTFKWFAQFKGPEQDQVLKDFQSALGQANARVLAETVAYPDLRGMGTTLTLAYSLNDVLFVAHVGDSRCYLCRHGVLYRLTRDHTLVEDMVRRGDLTPEEAARHRWRHMITNFVGGDTAEVNVEVHKVQMEGGDQVLLCTDGLTEMLSEEEINTVLCTEAEPEQVCRRLVLRANAAGGRDNITAVVAHFRAATQAETRYQSRLSPEERTDATDPVASAPQLSKDQEATSSQAQGGAPRRVARPGDGGRDPAQAGGRALLKAGALQSAIFNSANFSQHRHRREGRRLGGRHGLCASIPILSTRSRAALERFIMKWLSILLAIGLTGLGFQGVDRGTNLSSQAMFVGEGKRERGAADAKVKGKDDNYYMLVLASQGEPPIARLSHTFACFVKAGGSPDQRILETMAISWLPKSLNVVVGRLLPEEGINLDLLPTLKWARGLETKVSAWGPYGIKKDLYDRALTQKARLESGAVRYKALDLKTLLNRMEISNCIHAVSDIAGAEVLATGTAHGEAAGRMVVRHLQPWIINPGKTHNWVNDALALKNHPIRFQK